MHDMSGYIQSIAGDYIYACYVCVPTAILALLTVFERICAVYVPASMSMWDMPLPALGVIPSSCLLRSAPSV